MTFSADALRPCLHFLPQQFWINDPNGLIYWRGRHHLFYQHNPVEARHGNIVWGHASSEDLLNWQHHPIALRPEMPYDHGGCYSGCAVAEHGDAGPLTLLYTGVVWGDASRPTRQTQVVAVSDDGMHFERLGDNPVIADPPAGIHPRHFRDPFVWRDPSDPDEPWRMALTGSTQAGGEYDGDACVLEYRGRSLAEWRYDREVLRSPRDLGWWAHECPNHVQIDACRFLVTSPQLSWRTWWWPQREDGTYQHDDGRRLDLGDCFYAPLSWQHQGRTLMLGWLRETRPPEAALAAGWAGCLSLPRELYLDGQGRLAQRPAKELASWRDRSLGGDPPPTHEPLELAVVASPGSALAIHYCTGHPIRVTLPNGSTAGPGREPQHYRVFVDRSVVEVFSAAGKAAAYRVYPPDPTVLRCEPEAGKVTDSWALTTLHTS